MTREEVTILSLLFLAALGLFVVGVRLWQRSKAGKPRKKDIVDWLVEAELGPKQFPGSSDAYRTHNGVDPEATGYLSTEPGQKEPTTYLDRHEPGYVAWSERRDWT